MKLKVKAELSKTDRAWLGEVFSTFNERFDEMSQELDNLRSEVARATTVEGSALVLIRSMATKVGTIQAQLLAQGVDNAVLSQLATDLGTGDNALAAAVAENTPAAPAPTPSPDPAPAPADAPAPAPAPVPADPSTP